MTEQEIACDKPHRAPYFALVIQRRQESTQQIIGARGQIRERTVPLVGNPRWRDVE